MRFHYAWRTKNHKSFSTGISLHGHTWYSKESLTFLPSAVEKIYGLPSLLRFGEKKYRERFGTDLDYSDGYWTSPVTPEAAYELESKQIEERGLAPLVSLTNHDDTAGCKDIISLEWTAPYKAGIFHIGVHNLPREKAPQILAELRAATELGVKTQKAGSPESVESASGLLSMISSLPGTLVILNHPVTDQGWIGREMFVPLLNEFLKETSRHIHALEINALQPWLVNRRVIKLAKDWNLPVIAGGDRHGFEPSGAINITNASTFGEFAHEIRDEKKSEILLMPQFRKNLALRYMQQIDEVIADYPELGLRAHWCDRVFFKCPDGVTRSITEMSGKSRSMPKNAKRLMLAVEIANLLAKPLTPALSKVRSSTLER